MGVSAERIQRSTERSTDERGASVTARPTAPPPLNGRPLGHAIVGADERRGGPRNKLLFDPMRSRSASFAESDPANRAANGGSALLHAFLVPFGWLEGRGTHLSAGARIRGRFVPFMDVGGEDGPTLTGPALRAERTPHQLRWGSLLPAPGLRLGLCPQTRLFDEQPGGEPPGDGNEPEGEEEDPEREHTRAVARVEVEHRHADGNEDCRADEQRKASGEQPGGRGFRRGGVRRVPPWGPRSGAKWVAPPIQAIDGSGQALAFAGSIGGSGANGPSVRVVTGELL